MTYALIGHKSASGSTTFSTAGLDTTGADLLVVSMTCYDANIATLSDSKSNIWTPLTKQSLASSAYERLFYCQAPTVDVAQTFTLTGVGNIFGALNMLAFSGSPPTPLDAEAAGASGSAFAGSAQTGSVTPGATNELWIAAFSFNTAATIAVDSSFTISDQVNFTGGVNFGGALAYKIKTDALAENPAFTFTGSQGGGVAGAVFKVSIASPTPSTTDSATLGDAPPFNVLLGGQYALEWPTADISRGGWHRGL